MSSTDLLDGDLSALSKALQEKQVSSVELTKECLARATAAKALNAFITVDPEVSLAQARRADQRIAAGQAGPLTGIPLATKTFL